ncbi:MAG: 5'-nucleotidase SurE [candidate division TA06 bacterium 32_111]|uniref:5'-nucleotidase SurE n=2 Tax=Bacteria candidate phyla TaxID=1783234 RepID=A0A101I107_UNCT6|nr:MAG: 5'-nucleotidase SurE [candidate division TA06 bacterium 32_111]KUK86748.1 MAG: 5'-nucleotidase SurE [candidate division TA06 bacterium 34_109]HAF08284.1 5'/3'-nucleotidase SurE [candidate division WOR-3 bacterium]HCP16538.1 5'/3'-nucleotidase SurE [candidate division WOR-3 bacterium]
MSLKILISNDDGYYAEGIKTLKEILISLGHQVFVVAPMQNQSATSHSLTLTIPLRINRVSKNEYITTGTPTDCVLIATHGLIKEKFDYVFSGINHGPNMGEDVIYSGTVAAAMEGILMDIPSVAFSMAAFENINFSNAKNVVPKIIELLQKFGKKKRLLLNVNIPNGQIKGYRITKLGSRIYSDSLITKVDPRGRRYYWIGGEKPTFKMKKGTDFEAIEKGYVSITPITFDLTDFNILKNLKKVAKDVF